MDIRTLLGDDPRLVLGYFNAHHQLWYSKLGDDQKCALLPKQIDDSTFKTLNDDASIRIMSTCASFSDITIARSDKLCHLAHSSIYHLPIIESLNASRMYMNQKKAVWHDFWEFTNRHLNDLPASSNVQIAERIFREIINLRFIPAGRIFVVRPQK